MARVSCLSHLNGGCFLDLIWSRVIPGWRLKTWFTGYLYPGYIYHVSVVRCCIFPVGLMRWTGAVLETSGCCERQCDGENNIKCSDELSEFSGGREF